MARGWESKSVEDQVQEAKGSDHKRQSKKAQLTPEQLDARRRRDVLRLSRARVERELQSSQNPRYQEQLRQALADLDAQIAAITEAL
ncbi:MAG TPA: hypothetical protein VFW94_11210 [Candidatus Acidoferrales bacterium]|nr:hypothetical protein [Candidatus Acidoferrales bacterium]